MNILYYANGEYMSTDGRLALLALGHHVTDTNPARVTYDHDEVFIQGIENDIRKNKCDVVFSFNYYPDLSRAAEHLGVRYISWIVDSPHLTLDSLTLANPCNTVNLFDYAQYEKYAMMGIDTVRYMPLACNVARLERQLASVYAGERRRYTAELSFLGRLYDDRYNFFSQIKYLPPYIKGYLDAAMAAQTGLYGMNLVDHLVTEEMYSEIKKYASFDLGPDYRECGREILVDLIHKNITAGERKKLLAVLGEHYSVDFYSWDKPDIPVNFKGTASYEKKMPEVFATSKINLNITLRSIQTGIPLRVIDILGAGGFCISNYQAELAEYFENDRSIVWYESYEDLFEKVAYYLSHEEEREAIARAGHEIIREQFDYSCLMPKVLEPLT